MSLFAPQMVRAGFRVTYTKLLYAPQEPGARPKANSEQKRVPQGVWLEALLAKAGP
jgi:hypothetical protein